VSIKFMAVSAGLPPVRGKKIPKIWENSQTLLAFPKSA
jgi:hypothetical protein